MKRDWDCIRAILIALEEVPNSTSVLLPGDVRGWDEETVSHHVRLLEEDGLVEARCRPGRSAPVYCVALRMTSAGYELLEKLRSKELWSRIVALAGENGLRLSYEVVTRLASAALDLILGGHR